MCQGSLGFSFSFQGIRTFNPCPPRCVADVGERGPCLTELKNESCGQRREERDRFFINQGYRRKKKLSGGRGAPTGLLPLRAFRVGLLLTANQGT